MATISIEGARRRVRLGVQFLNEYAPKDWRERIEKAATTLNVGNMDHCPLAEAFKETRGPDRSVLDSAGDVCRSYGDKISAYAMGFYGSTEEDWEFLRQAWSEELSLEIID